MKKVSFSCLAMLLLAATFSSAAGAPQGLQASFFDELADLFDDSQTPDTEVLEYVVDIPRGGIAGVHILLNGLEEKADLNLSITRAGKTAPAARWYRLVDVPVEQNTGLAARLGSDNPHVIRKAPFRVFDALEPIEADLKVKSPVTALRLEIPIGSEDLPGPRKYTITLKSAGLSQTLTFQVNIYKTALVAVGKNSFPYTNWFKLDNMATYHQLEPFSPEHWTMIEKYARLMARARQNTFLIQLDVILEKQEDGTYILNSKRLIRLVDIFTRSGMYYIEGGHLAARTDGAWASKTFSVITAKGALATSRAGDKILADVCRQLMEQIESHGWRDRWLQHATDEPIESHMTEYRILTGMIRKYMPGLPIIDANMEATMDSIQLYGAQDIWCPKPNSYVKYRQAYEEMRSLGDQVWFYTCLDPRGPYLNRFMDQERMRPMLIGWGASLYDLDGFLHWGFNWYHFNPEDKTPIDPFNQTVKGNLPPGDTHVVYPGSQGPWSSTRLEAHRVGFEDYELLKMLKAKNPQRAGDLIEQLIRGFDDYTKDTRLYRTVRRNLLTELDRNR